MLETLVVANYALIERLEVRFTPGLNILTGEAGAGQPSGKGTLFVQGSPLPLASLRELTSLLFDMHGQHEHQSLLTPDNHRKLLDRYGDCTSQVEEFGAAHARLPAAREKP